LWPTCFGEKHLFYNVTPPPHTLSIILLKRKVRILQIFGMKYQKHKQCGFIFLLPVFIIFTRGMINSGHDYIKIQNILGAMKNGQKRWWWLETFFF